MGRRPDGGLASIGRIVVVQFPGACFPRQEHVFRDVEPTQVVIVIYDWQAQVFVLLDEVEYGL